MTTETGESADLAKSGTNAIREIAGLFFKLGCIAFGGPAAHISMMHDEVVTRRRWVTNEEFVDLMGATNLIPGPNSTEMAIHLGFLRGGWRGLVVAGTLFIVPAFVIVLAFAWAYVRYGTTPGATWLLYGVKPVIIAIVIQALWRLGTTALRSATAAVVGIAVVAGYLAGINELVLLFGGGVVVLFIQQARRIATSVAAVGVAGIPVSDFAWRATATTGSSDASLITLFLTFLKIGSVLYGSGYVLVAFLHNDFVVRLGWLTDQQLLDAVAVGQFTPGPVFTTATFVGYLVAGWQGAVLATIAIFLPSFLFVALLNPLVPRLRGSEVFSSLLDGVNAAAIGLMAGVTWTLGRDAIVDWWTAAMAVIAVVCLLRFRLPSAWLIIIGAAAGVVHHYLLG